MPEALFGNVPESHAAAGCRGFSGDVLPEKPHRARARFQFPGQDAQKAGLAVTADAGNADDFAAVHGEFDVGKAADVFAARKRYAACFKNLFPGLPRFSRQFRRFRADHKARKRVFGFLFGIHG